ncbi:major facilitator superfamily domain-containing protein [Scenedesmus sp. NREL 46B-D3]|nr:major facilitator superfamily domain-containing protein [Scenedesmus sp. NREL 46B-D3]
MQANNAGSWAAGDAALVLELQQPHPLALTDSPADIAVEAAAAPAHGASMLEPTKAATGFSGHVGCPSEGGPSLPQQLSSIYHVFTRRQRGLILGVVSVSQFINPFSSSIILPSLKLLQTVFNTSSVVGAAIVALYYLPVGIASLLWGPACDMWGRKVTYLVSTALYAAATVGCIFPVNISMLLGFRALQGAALGAYRGAGVGAVADIYPPQQRGLAIGIVMVSTLVGPVIGPVLGGFLAEAYGWRAPFIALLAFSALIFICCSLAMRETHQYKTLQRIIKENPSAAHTIAEAPQILAHKPRFSWSSPLTPLALVLEKQIVLHLLVGLVGFACWSAVKQSCRWYWRAATTCHLA